MTKTWDVAVAGEIYADHIFSGFDRWPKPGEEHFTDHYVREAGGGAAITACALGHLNRKVAIFGVMGEQDLWLRQRLLDFSVSLDALRSVVTATAVSVAISTREDRSFLTWPGANRGLEEYLREPATQLRLAQAKHVHFAMPHRPRSCPRTLSQAARGRVYALPSTWATISVGSPIPPVGRPVPRSTISCPMRRKPRSSPALISQIKLVPGLRAKGIEHLVLKLGRMGASAWLEGQPYRASALPVDAVDTPPAPAMHSMPA